MHGSFAANIANASGDFIISWFFRFDDRLTGNPNTFAKNAKVAHIDIDPGDWQDYHSADFFSWSCYKKALQIASRTPTVHNN